MARARALPGRCLWVLAALGLLAPGGWAQVLALPMDGAWERQQAGAWAIHADDRELAEMRHPHVPSIKGGHALLRRSIRVPEDWSGPVALAFYCTDDYHGVPPTACSPGTAVTVLPGRRFKQVLVDSVVVWNQDVADATGPDAAGRWRVRLPVAPGQTFVLGLMVYDAEDSALGRTDDFHCPDDAPREAAMATRAYWGDAQLLAGDTEALPGLRPAEARVARRHAARWPAAPEGRAPWTGDAVRLRVDAPDLPKAGFPVRVGFPLPPGRVSEAAEFRLRSGAGAPLPARKTPLARWPDDSWRWALLEFTATPGLDAVEVQFRRDTSPPPASPQIDGDTLRAGDLRLRLSEGNVLEGVEYRGRPALGALRVALQSAGESAPGTTGPPRWSPPGAPGALQCEGVFDGQRRAHGRFSLALYPQPGLPLLRLALSVFNDTGAALPLQALELDIALPTPPEAWTYGGLPLPATGRLEQLDQGPPQLEGGAWEGVPASDAFCAGSLTLIVEDFRARFPKTVRWNDAGVTVDLCAAPLQPVMLQPGEGLSHEVWLGFGMDSPDALAAAVRQAPLLVNPDYARATGAWGHLPDLPGDHPLLARLAAHAALDEAALGLGTGLRHHTAQPHFAGPGHWANNFTERLLGTWMAWGLTGDRRWHDRARAFGRHLLDVAVLHSDAPGLPAGAMRGPGHDHAGPAWPPVQRATGLYQAGWVTGDPAYLAAAAALAEYCAAAQPGQDQASARHHAAPLESFAAAYEATGDPVWLDVAAEAVDAVWRRIDRRRGAWDEVNASWTHRATVPWHAAQAGRALYRWYQVSGDVEAAQAVVALADAVLWEAAGDAPPYAPESVNPAPFLPGLVALLAMAHDLSGDATYARHAERLNRDWLAAGAPVSPFDTLWMIDAPPLPAAAPDAPPADPGPEPAE